MAPILSFTAEEIWSLTAASQDETVFTHTWDEFPATVDAQPLLDRWKQIREVRAEVQKQLEEARVAGRSAPRCRPKSRYLPAGATGTAAIAGRRPALRADHFKRGADQGSHGRRGGGDRARQHACKMRTLLAL